MDDPSDVDLFTQWREGDSGAANSLVRRYDVPLADFFRLKTTPQECDDLRQQVWLELAKSRAPEFQVGFRAYLFGIARHVLFRHLERKKRVPIWDPLSTSLVDLDRSLSQEVAQRLGAQDLAVILQRLPVDVQVLLELRYFHDLSIAELAAIYVVPEGTIKSRLSHARKQLEKELHCSRIG